ncbi:hypothetical protein K523DRAFT_335537 [Schizophyllum commune Tattone D]|nr:hypothetical protein K523DRAFT_335537 [Schizophyllum commune Tattone D]
MHKDPLHRRRRRSITFRVLWLVISDVESCHFLGRCEGRGCYLFLRSFDRYFRFNHVFVGMNFLHHFLRHDLRIRRGPAALKENAQEERRSVAGRRKGSKRRDGSTRPRWPQV